MVSFIKTNWVLSRWIIICLLSPLYLYGQDSTNTKIISKKDFQWRGYANAGMHSFFTDRSNSTDKSIFGYSLSAGVTLSFKNFSLPFNVIYSDRQATFNGPKNVFARLGISPKYKFLTLHAGYRTYNLSPYILNGCYVLGGGFDVKLKAFKFSTYYGRIENDNNLPPTLFYKKDLSPYKRNILAFRIGFEKTNSLFEIVATKAHDKKDSKLADSLSLYSVFPGQNFALGTNLRFKFFKHLVLEGNGAASATTSNINALPINDANANKTLDKYKFLLTVNESSTYAFAYQARIGLDYNKWGIGFRYQKIDPFYAAWGLNYIIADIKQYTSELRFTAFENNFQFNGSFGIESNNTKTIKSTSQIRKIANASASVVLSKNSNLYLSFNNFNTNPQPEWSEGVDSLQLSTQSKSLNGSYSKRWGPKDKTNNISANIVFSDYYTFYTLNQQESSSSNKTWTNQVSYMKKLKKDGPEVGGALTYSILELPGYTDLNRFGVSARYRMAIIKKINLGANAQYALNQTNGQRDGSIFTLQGSLNYNLLENTNLTFSAQLLNRKTKILTPINDVNMRISISQTFK
ncbi:MAG: hypothetical protein KBA06_02005 [Saprospiraceae bacterium]|nr:hypothetical protein [Saprospiraceae bacterium]